MDPSSIHLSVTLPLSLGGLGIRSAFRSRESAHWASWADCLAMVKARHPIVAARIVGELGGFTPVACLGDVQVCALALGVVGIELPSWSSLADGARPVLARGDVQDQPRSGWQREVSLKAEQHFRDTRLLPTMTETRRPSGGCPVHQLPHGQAVPGLSHSVSVFCCSAVFASHSPCHNATAGVAVHSTSLATTVQLAQWQGCWVAGASQWRAWWLAYAVKEVPE